ncbi:MAG: energy transducer TonB [Oleispira antarctica]|nr:energy transducer TonB [Oleispira antarctica]MBQ0791268.1 energy transducer TonB [Oleispira antarctica]
MKLILAFLCSIIVTGSIFAVMSGMVSSDGAQNNNQGEQTVIDFIRLKQDSESRLKQRDKKEPPKPKKPLMPPEQASQQNTPMKQIAMRMPNISPDLSLANKSLLGDAQIGMGFGDGDVIPLVRMPAQYPNKAKRRNIEGFVKARLEVNVQGTVDSVEIIDAKPRGVFERSAIRALYKYKFKPQIIDGKPQPQTVTQTLEYTLDKG